MVLKLYKLDASPPVRAVYMVIQALDVPDVDYIDINLLNDEHLREEYMNLNPQHTVPTLEDDDFTIWDSHAIAVYLVNKYGKDDSLYPTNPKQRALVDQRLHFDSGILFPALRGSVEPIIFWGEKSLKPENLAKVKCAYDFLEKFLMSPWLAGDNVTLADLCCVATVSSMNEILPIDASTYPNLAAWLQRCSEQEFYVNGNEPGLVQFRELIKRKLS